MLLAFLVLSVALLLSLGAVLAPSGASAQDMATTAHPAHIHAGTCAGLSDVVFPLSDVSRSIMMDGTPMAMGDVMGATAVILVEWRVTTIAAPLADIVAGGHSINVHESTESIGNYIACGDIGATMMGTTDLAIGRGALNDSGITRLHDNGDGTTSVTVYLTHTGGMM